MSGANLTDADLSGANLTDANLTVADLVDANLPRQPDRARTCACLMSAPT